MILDTFTTRSLARARFISAITFLQVLWFIAFHRVPSFTISFVQNLQKGSFGQALRTFRRWL
jgi:hypothetical protein